MGLTISKHFFTLKVEKQSKCTSDKQLQSKLQAEGYIVCHWIFSDLLDADYVLLFSHRDIRKQNYIL